MKAFWIVAKEGCTFQSTKRHESLKDAKIEAERLSMVEGRTFFVFKCLGSIKPAKIPVEWEGVE